MFSTALRSLLVMIALCGLCVPAFAAKPTNVVLILADDLGAHDLGCYGSTFHKTPELDRLASEGMRFTQAYAACPVCSPTRAALMTGKYPARLHITDWISGEPDNPENRVLRPNFLKALPSSEITLAELLRDQGYVTGHIGKWHLGGEGSSPLDHGFQSNIAGDETGTPLSYFAPFEKNGRKMPGLEIAPAGQYLTDRYGEEADKFIAAHKEQPFFLYLPHNAVHTPLQAPQDLIAEFPAATPFKGQQNNPTYAAMLLSLDRAIGRVRKALADHGLQDNTLILFTSDNGGLSTHGGQNGSPATSNAPLREGKGFLYEGGIRVPLIVAGPGVKSPGSTSAAVVSSQDVLPTVCELLGVPLTHAIDGESFAGVLKGDAPPASRTLYWHYPHFWGRHLNRPGGVIRDGDWKLIEFYDTGRRELFDLKQDPREVRNLAGDKPDVVEQLANKLDAWRTKVGAQLMTPNPDYHPNTPEKNGQIVLWAKTADIHGTTLRFEPMPHKNTLGYWSQVTDWASWEFEPAVGKYRVEGFIGCGTNCGGSRVEFAVGDWKSEYTVKETGGFQNFEPVDLGTLEIPKPGRYELTVKPQTKPGPAVMDVRKITLIPVR